MRKLLVIPLILLANAAFADSSDTSGIDQSDPFMTDPSAMMDQVNGISMILPTPPTAAVPAPATPASAPAVVPAAAPATTTTTTTTTPAGAAAPTAITQTVVVQAPPAAAVAASNSSASQAEIQQLQAANSELSYSLGAQQAAYQNLYMQQQYQAQDQGASTAMALVSGIVIGSVVTSLVSSNHYYYGGYGWGYPSHSTYINYHPVYVGPTYHHSGWGPYNHPTVPVSTKVQDRQQWNQNHVNHQVHPYQPTALPRSAIKTGTRSEHHLAGKKLLLKDFK